MKSRICLLALLINLASNASYGKAIDEATAKLVGIAFLTSIGMGPVSDATTVYRPTSAINGIDATSFYVFNVNPTGFVIVSADDRVQPILGYSRETVFNYDSQNRNVVYWMNGYQQEINYAIQNNVTPAAETKEKWDELISRKGSRVAKTTSVGPLLTTKWNQSPYFNDLCPYDVLQRAHAVTGCVATAMAQVMKYWNWPVVGCGSHTYQHVLYGPQTVNFGATKYQWDAMRDSLGGPDTAVATLMYSAGVSVDMQYGVDGSGAWVIPGDSMQTNITSYALQTYFHYKPSLTSVARSGDDLMDSMTTTKWEQMLVAELDASRPVIYAGFNNVEGHCWVCDGYETDSFFHFNWGWGGMSNGYFTLKTPAGFSQEHEAIIGIEPDAFPDNTGSLQLQNCLTTSSSPVRYGGPFSVKTKIVNKGGTQFSGDFCAQVYDSSGKILGTLQTINGQKINVGDSTSTLTFATSGMYDLISGIYSIRVLHRSTGTDQWIPVANNGDYINYTVMGIADDTDIMLYQPIRIIEDTLAHGSPASINVHIADIGQVRFTGNLDIGLYDINTGVQIYDIGQKRGLYINPYDKYECTFTDSNLAVPPGKYILILKHQYTDTGGYYVTGSAWMTNPIVVNVGGVMNFNANEIYVYPNPANNMIYVDPYNNELNEVRLVNILGQVVKNIQAAMPHLVTSISLADIDPGIYIVELLSNGHKTTKKIVVVH